MHPAAAAAAPTEGLADRPPRAAPAQSLGHRREIDGLRAIAVLGVVYCHAAATTGPHHGAIWWEAIGARGVDLFFVISGFCLSWPYDRGQTFSASSMLTFLRRRLTRIAPTAWVALALFVLLSWTAFGFPTQTIAHVAPHDQNVEILRDAIFFPTLAPIHDPPMWTLGIEMRWYVVFLPLLVLFYRSRVAFAVLMAAFYVTYARVGIPDIGVLPTFMLGIVAAALVKSNAKFNAVWPVVAPFAIGFAIYDQSHARAVEYGDPAWAIASFTTVVAVSTNAWLRRCFAWPPLVAVGVASYSIYLVHHPFLDALFLAGAPPLAAAIASVAIGFAFWFVVERTLCSSRARRAMDAWMVGSWRAVMRKNATLPARPVADAKR